jgi:hypothetical protein
VSETNRKYTRAAHHLLESLLTNAPPRNSEIEAAKAKERSPRRFADRAAA